MPKTTLIQVRLPDQDADAIKKIARRKGIAMAELVRRLLSKALREKDYDRV